MGCALSTQISIQDEIKEIEKLTENQQNNN
jgi:hypothetical protein